jgi:hypothetical protein
MYIEQDILFQNGILCSKKTVYLLQSTTTNRVSFFLFHHLSVGVGGVVVGVGVGVGVGVSYGFGC